MPEVRRRVPVETKDIFLSHDAQDVPSRSAWATDMQKAWICFLVVRILGTLAYGLISDCDETFNYWEPTHMLLYGRGLQTWEYSPQYALRSYAYAGFHAVLGFLAGGAWAADKVAVFHGTRLLLAALCATCEAVFYRGVLRQFGPQVARYCLAGLLCSAGMLHVAPAYLPSTFTMYGLLVAWGTWMAGDSIAAVWAAVIGLACGWPFAVVALLPLVAHIGLTQCINWEGMQQVARGQAWPTQALLPKAWRIAAHAIASLCTVLFLQSCVDRFFYSAWLIAPWNIIKYNALGQGGGGQGSDLYGVEPASYYAKNMLLNFNVVALLAAVAPLVVAERAFRRAHGWDYAATITAQFVLWLAAMWPRPHKEERFLFVIYPLFPLLAAFTLQLVEGLVASAVAAVLGKPSPRAARQAVLLSLVICTGGASLMRVGALVDSFSAPFAAWGFLSQHLVDPAIHPLPYPVHAILHTGPSKTRVTTGPRVCVGKEWYRFPSSFFLPEYTRARAGSGSVISSGGPAQLSFLKSGFGGLLPQPYLPPPIFNATRIYREGFNDENREEEDRYVPVASCDYIVDFQLPTPRSTQDGARYEPHFEPGAMLSEHHVGTCTGTCRRDETVWRSIFSRSFLHADSSPALTRALYIPGLSRARNVYGVYHVLVRETCGCD